MMAAPSGDFKWFGEGFDGFPKRLPDDTVEYAIYIIDTHLANAQRRSRLNAILQAANELTKKSLKDYIWQREAFALSLEREDGTWLLRGRTNYGDSVSDEWLIVFLLRELSKKFPDSWTRVYDSDGEFLLIEAANALPKWLNPEIADSRVWINRGQLRIIPLDKGVSSTRDLTIKQALSVVSADFSKLIHSPLIEEEAFYRIRNYPASINDSLHHSQLIVPRRLTYILHHNPSYISPAIEAFYLRDPISLKPLQASDTSRLTLPPVDFVTSSVRFNRVGFAQLKSQEYPAPPAWEDHVNGSSPADATKADLGMKLTCGFEMMLSDPQNRDKKAVREIRILLGDLETGDETLPTDSEIASWTQKDDDESWLDINFEDFEKTLDGKGANPKDTTDPTSTGFGDKAAEENLRKMVERFEKFMNDEDAGVEGAEMDEMDFDDDEDDDLDDEDDSGSEEEDKEVSFDENEFIRMMREMMGMPADGEDVLDKDRSHENRVDDADHANTSDVKKLDSDSNNSDSEESVSAEEIRLLSEQMEAELNGFGALNLDPTPRKIRATRLSGKGKAKVNSKGKGVESGEEEQDEDDDDEEEELGIDFNLAKNMLESFKGQIGTSGPAGNLMGLLNVKMPRDEPDGKKDQA
jgi:hypothetical protein